MTYFAINLDFLKRSESDVNENQLHLSVLLSMFCDFLFCTPKLLSRDKGVFKAETERCQRVSVGVEVDRRKLGKTKAIVIFASQGIYGEQSGPKTRWAIVSDMSYVHE